jgi:hypothetical protein
VNFRQASLCVAQLIVTLAWPVLAQSVGGSGTASLAGVVTDQTGAVLVGATVKISRGTELIQTAVTNDQGRYSVKGLPAGTYDLSASAEGFKVFQAPGIVLNAGDDIPLDATLEPAGAVTTTTVEGQKTGQVETETAEVSGTITQKEVVSLGLNGRNFTQLIALAPGVSNQTGQDEAKVGVSGSVKYSVNGGRVEYNTFDVDGSDLLNVGINGANSTLIVYPSLDAIQEVKVLTSNYGAMYGRTASGTVLVTTKSGTAQFHGSGYEFLRNEVFNARNYFDQTKHAPLYRKNDFGGTIGGPLFIPNVYNVNKDKTYFFFSEEFRYESAPEPQDIFNQAVPTLEERAGNFSDVCPPGGGLFTRSKYPDCPGSTSGTVGQFQALPNNQVPVLDRNALAILSTGVIPAPNATSGCNSSLVGKTDPTTGNPIMPCYDVTISPPTNWREELFRLDHNFTPKLKGTFRYIHDSWNTTVATPQWGYVQNSFPTIENHFVGPGVSMVARLTQTISPSLLNEVVFSYTDSHITLTDTNGPGAQWQRPAALDSPCVGSQCPIGNLFNNGFGGKMPGVVIGGTNAEYGGNGFAVDAGYMPWDHTNPTYSGGDNVSKAIGKHLLQFGGQFVIYQRNQTNSAIGAATGDLQGIVTFSNQSAVSNGNAFADFLAGNIRSFQQDSAQLKYYQRYQLAEPYFQDDWKATSRLTVNLGLRVSLFGTYYEKNNNAYNWDPSAFNRSLASQALVDPNKGNLVDANSGFPIPINLGNLDPRITNGLVRCGVNRVPASCMRGHLFNPAPRIGLAWDPKGDGKTSIRAGYGIFFEHGTGDEANTGSLEASSPPVLDMTQNFPSSWSCIGGGSSVSSQLNCGYFGAFPLSVTAIPQKAVWPYVQQWSLSVQRELPKDMVATFAYVGSKGTHLTTELEVNQLAPLTNSLNPFGPHEPLIGTLSPGLGDCGGFNGGSFFLLNNTTVTAAQPAFVNLEASCYGLVLPNVPGTQPPPDPNALRQFAPGLARIFSLQNVADSAYNAFQTTLRRVAGPLTLGVSYTFSHSLDDSSDRSDATFVNSFDLRANRASSNFDQRHLLNISYVYGLDRLADKLRYWFSDEGYQSQEPGSPPRVAMPMNPSPINRVLLDNWQLSGITVYQSGTPFSVINGGSNTQIGTLDNAGVANGAGAGSYADVVGDPHARPPFGGKNPQSIGPLLLNPAAFVAPRGLTFGDSGRNFLNNPGRLNFDMALLKDFKITESSRLEFRMEVFNIFNHTQFRIYDPNLGNTANNTISCYGPGAYTAFSRNGQGVVSSSPNFTGPDFSAAGGIASVTTYNNGMPTTSLETTDCLTGSSFLHPVNAHRPRTMQFGVKYTF